jgi:hypothetical protein
MRPLGIGGRGMRTTVTVVTTGNARRADVTIEAPATTPLDAIVSRLRDLVSAPPDATATVGGTAFGLRRDGDGNGAGSAAMSLFGGGAMRDGVIVTFGASPGPTDTRSYLELRVVAGPFAGDIHRLAMGTSWVGRGDLATIGINDPGISRRHALLTVDPDGVRVADAGSTNGTTLDGVPVGTCPIPLRQGMRLRMGSSALTVAIPDVVPMSVRPTADGHLSFNRPPRLVVNADIRANTNLRICLGVVRESESRDVIDATDAARISRATPGRGYARTGHGELQAFPTGRVGGLPADQADTARIDVQLSPLQSLCVPRLTPSAKHATSPACVDRPRHHRRGVSFGRPPSRS